MKAQTGLAAQRWRKQTQTQDLGLKTLNKTELGEKLLALGSHQGRDTSWVIWLRISD